MRASNVAGSARWALVVAVAVVDLDTCASVAGPSAQWGAVEEESLDLVVGSHLACP